MAEIPSHCDALVVGGGCAGIAAAVELAAAGLDVVLCEQGPRLGGAIHRQPASGSACIDLPRGVADQWRRLSEAIASVAVTSLTGHVFLGIDADGIALLEDRRAGRVIALRCPAVVLAVGAVERIRPRPGWQLAGVTTAGGMQVMMKETGRAPSGRILIAGNGPLPVALAAQLAALGNPPIAVLESGDPMRQVAAGLGLLAHPRLATEALGYLVKMRAAGVRWRRGTSLAAIEQDGDMLAASIVGPRGKRERIVADHIALHDGIRPNSFGLPEPGDGDGRLPLVVHAGDCREALGAVAAEADGRRAAAQLLAALRGDRTVRTIHDRHVARERKAQAILSRLFRPISDAGDVARLPDETIVCRCEGRSAGDLRRLLEGGSRYSLREIKLNGRFGMGTCQGRFCADAVMDFVAVSRPDAARGDPADLAGRRWPARPVPIASIIAPEPTPDLNKTVDEAAHDRGRSSDPETVHSGDRGAQPL